MGRINIKTAVNFGVVITLLAFCIYFVYFVPRAKYAGKAITAEILNGIPMDAGSWRGNDLADIGDEPEGEVYNFLSRVFARHYVNSHDTKKNVLLIVLDAGNFHYPKVCFRGAGFTSEELPERELELKHGKMKIHLMLSKKKDKDLLSVYWICIDKKIIPTWAGQKLKQLYYSLFNKKRVGLMVRLDMPFTGDINDSVEVARSFLNNLYRASPPECRGYVFGE